MFGSATDELEDATRGDGNLKSVFFPTPQPSPRTRGEAKSVAVLVLLGAMTVLLPEPLPAAPGLERTDWVVDMRSEGGASPAATATDYDGALVDATAAENGETCGTALPAAGRPVVDIAIPEEMVPRADWTLAQVHHRNDWAAQLAACAESLRGRHARYHLRLELDGTALPGGADGELAILRPVAGIIRGADGEAEVGAHLVAATPLTVVPGAADRYLVDAICRRSAGQAVDDGAAGADSWRHVGDGAALLDSGALIREVARSLSSGVRLLIIDSRVAAEAASLRQRLRRVRLDDWIPPSAASSDQKAQSDTFELISADGRHAFGFYLPGAASGFSERSLNEAAGAARPAGPGKPERTFAAGLLDLLTGESASLTREELLAAFPNAPRDHPLVVWFGDGPLDALGDGQVLTVQAAPVLSAEEIAIRAWTGFSHDWSQVRTLRARYDAELRGGGQRASLRGRMVWDADNRQSAYELEEIVVNGLAFDPAYMKLTYEPRADASLLDALHYGLPEDTLWSLDGEEDLPAGTCYRLRYLPKPTKKDRKRGRIWVRKSDYRIIRVRELEPDPQPPRIAVETQLDWEPVAGAPGGSEVWLPALFSEVSNQHDHGRYAQGTARFRFSAWQINEKSFTEQVKELEASPHVVVVERDLEKTQDVIDKVEVRAGATGAEPQTGDAAPKGRFRPSPRPPETSWWTMTMVAGVYGDADGGFPDLLVELDTPRLAQKRQSLTVAMSPLYGTLNWEAQTRWGGAVGARGLSTVVASPVDLSTYLRLPLWRGSSVELSLNGGTVRESRGDTDKDRPFLDDAPARTYAGGDAAAFRWKAANVPGVFSVAEAVPASKTYQQAPTDAFHAGLEWKIPVTRKATLSLGILAGEARWPLVSSTYRERFGTAALSVYLSLPRGCVGLATVAPTWWRAMAADGSWTATGASPSLGWYLAVAKWW